MATFTEESVISKVEVLEGHTLQVQRVDRVRRDGEVISEKPWRGTYAPMQEIPADLLALPGIDLRSIVTALWVAAPAPAPEPDPEPVVMPEPVE